MFPNSALAEDDPLRDFRNYLILLWEHLGLPEPTPVQLDVAYWLQYGPDRQITEGFRGMGKSFVTAGFATWCWLNDPDYKIMVVSGSKSRADDFSQFCLMILQTFEPVKHLAPRRDQRKSLEKFDVNGARPDQSASCKSVGISGQLTGSRADLIIGDDVETPTNSMTAGMREKLETQVTEFEAILKPLPQRKIMFLGTPQNEDSLYGKLETKGYVCRIWPARMPARATVGDKYGDRLAPMVRDMDIPDDSPVDPIRFNEEDLLKRAAAYGASGFALQFMLDTSLDDDLKFPLKCRDLIVTDLDREIAPIKFTYGSGKDQLITDLDCAGMKGDRFYRPMYVSEDHAEYQGKIMVIDPSGRGADRTGYAVINHSRGLLYLRRAGSTPGGYETAELETLAHIARAEGVHEILVESNFGDGMFTQLLKPVLKRVYPCTVEEYSVHTQKEMRIIDTLEPVLNQHRLIVDRKILVSDLQQPKEHQLVHQLTRICRQRDALSHDDVLDAVAGGVRYWVDRMDISLETSEEDHRREAMDAELDAFMEHCGLSGPGNPRWR